MAEGVRSTNLPAAAIVVEVLGHRDAGGGVLETVRTTVADLKTVLGVPAAGGAASHTEPGLVELATGGEVNTGTDDERAVTSAGLAGKKMVDWIPVLIETPANGDYVISRDIPGSITILSITTKCASGSCTLTGKIDGVALGGAANTVTSAEQKQTHSSANVAGAGGDIALTVSANATCLRLEATVVFSRVLGVA